MPEKQNAKTFEQNMTELDKIVQSLESGAITLDESLKQYEKGVALIRACHQQLDFVKRKLEVLSGLDENGNAITQPMEDEVLDNEQKVKARSARRGYKKTATDDPQQPSDGGGLFDS